MELPSLDLDIRLHAHLRHRLPELEPYQWLILQQRDTRENLCYNEVDSRMEQRLMFFSKHQKIIAQNHPIKT